MVTQKRAQELLQRTEQPFLTTEEVAHIAGVKPITPHQWVARGYAKLRGSVRPGRGQAMFFSFADLIEALAFAHLSRLGFPPKAVAGGLSEVILSCAVRRLQDLAGVWGDPDSLSDPDFKRYVLAWHDAYGISWAVASSPNIPGPLPHAAWITLDSHVLLERAILGLEALQRDR